MSRVSSWQSGSSTPRENIDLALDEMGVAELFDAIIGSEDVSVGKPDPTVFLTAAQQLGVSAGDCLVIEDVPAGVEAALAAKMLVVALAGTHPVDKLQKATRVVSSLRELIPSAFGTG